jgi:hypothetical protein
MSSESWFKVSLPAFPAAFTIFGGWLYWGDNPVALLPPPIAFWGLVILFYLFTHTYVPSGRRYPIIVTISATSLWLVASITSHNLATFLSSNRQSGFVEIIAKKDFWFAYVCAALACAVGVWHFRRLEPLIVAQAERERTAARMGE